ncbi:hypothetical protein ATY41_09040 [Leifsonia xyli subsp. xyli]|uniref:HpcH/HpaI aldolase/citrate lyase domain-containing protein n=1 Tax=Leifsonia xyli subsp. xyli TaxID=59736 RepID=A0A1E2SLI7_LEIXY|nr:hypothetical protein [Leifsonia xyli]ODA90673.1 hypothetical protein ATY41_09040 [Leifsonia xyli subsp. xyli]
MTGWLRDREATGPILQVRVNAGAGHEIAALRAIGAEVELRTDTEHGRRLGWIGRVAAHPSQLPVIAEVFATSPEELAWASAVLAAVGDGGVGTLPSGEMVDPAMLGRARAILDRR